MPPLAQMMCVSGPFFCTSEAARVPTPRLLNEPEGWSASSLSKTRHPERRLSPGEPMSGVSMCIDAGGRASAVMLSLCRRGGLCHPKSRQDVASAEPGRGDQSCQEMLAFTATIR